MLTVYFLVENEFTTREVRWQNLKQGKSKGLTTGRHLHLSNPKLLSKRWEGIIGRCYSPDHPSYQHYGARGIKVSDEFRQDRIAFSFYIDSLPRKKGQDQLDRRDNGGNYERGNLRWVTPMANSRNKRSNKTIVHRGHSYVVSEFIEKFNVCKYFCKTTIYKWIRIGFTADYILDRVEERASGGFRYRRSLTKS